MPELTAELDPSGWPHVYSEGVGPVLLMLHGTGSNEHEITELARRINPTAGILAPRGRVNENGATRWFRRHAEGVFDVDDVIARAGELAAFVSWAESEHHLADRRMIAVGFSNGANIALALAALHPDTVKRVVAFSGMYPFGERETPNELAGSEFLLLNGAADAMAPVDSVNRLVEQLEKQGADVRRVTRAGGHGITEDELAEAAGWLS